MAPQIIPGLPNLRCALAVTFPGFTLPNSYFCSLELLVNITYFHVAGSKFPEGVLSTFVWFVLIDTKHIL